MWTPAIERDRRIALQDRSTRFFGTDFSFEDLEERDVDQYDYALLGEETVDGAPAGRSSRRRSRRSRRSTRASIVWIRKDNYALARIENYVKDQAVRRLNYARHRQNVQGIWTARQLEMADLRRGSRTRLTLDKLQYNCREGRRLHAAGDPPPVTAHSSARALRCPQSFLVSCVRRVRCGERVRRCRRRRSPSAVSSRRAVVLFPAGRRRTITLNVVGDLLAREEVFVKPRAVAPVRRRPRRARQHARSGRTILARRHLATAALSGRRCPFAALSATLTRGRSRSTSASSSSAGARPTS